MACFEPMVAHRTRSRTRTGKFRMKFLCKATSFSRRGHVWSPDLMLLPCRSCIGCRLEQSRQTAMRLVHELRFHSYSGFLTLTYDDAHLPPGRSLDRKRWRKFVNDWRGRFDYAGQGKLKIFGVGEYGDLSERPHYHAIVYSEVPLLVDEVEPSRRGDRQFTNPVISEVWPDGRHRISEVTFESAAYCARYVLKKMVGEKAEKHYEFVDPVSGEVFERAREFAAWPKGLAKAHFEQWFLDIYPSDEVVLPGRGKFLPPPYYDRLLEKLDPEFCAQVKLARSEMHDKHKSEAEWFGLIQTKERTKRVQILRQRDFCPRSVE